MNHLKETANVWVKKDIRKTAFDTLDTHTPGSSSGITCRIIEVENVIEQQIYKCQIGNTKFA